MDGCKAGKIIPCWCWKCHHIQVSIAELNRGEIYHEKVSAVQCASVVKKMLFPSSQSTPEYSKITQLFIHVSFSEENFSCQNRENKCMPWGKSTPSLSNHPDNLGKKRQCFRDKMVHTFPAREAPLFQVSAALALTWCLKVAPWWETAGNYQSHRHLRPPMNFFLEIPSLEKDVPVSAKNKAYIWK